MTKHKLAIKEIQQGALAIGETMRPTSDLCMYLRQKYGVSDHVVINAYRRAIASGAIQQVSTTRWAQNKGHHAIGMYNVKAIFYTWRISCCDGAKPLPKERIKQ